MLQPLSPALASSGANWKPVEAALFTLGRVSAEIVDLRGKIEHYQPPATFCGYVMPLLTIPSIPPLLKGRILWFMGRFAKELPAEFAASALQFSVQCLQSPDESVAVRILAAHAIQGFLRAVSFAEIQSQMPAIVGGVREISRGADGDSLVLIMEVALACAQSLCDFASAAPFDLLNAATVELTQVVMSVWNRSPLDNLLVSLLEDLVGVFCKRSETAVPAGRVIVESVMPLLVGAASGSSNIDSQIIAAAVSLLTCVVDAKFAPEAAEVERFALLAPTVYPILTLLVNNQSDLNLLQAGYVIASRNFKWYLINNMTGKFGWENYWLALCNRSPRCA
jgi:hypothetical protein